MQCLVISAVFSNALSEGIFGTYNLHLVCDEQYTETWDVTTYPVSEKCHAARALLVGIVFPTETECSFNTVPDFLSVFELILSPNWILFLFSFLCASLDY